MRRCLLRSRPPLETSLPWQRKGPGRCGLCPRFSGHHSLLRRRLAPELPAAVRAEARAAKHRGAALAPWDAPVDVKELVDLRQTGIDPDHRSPPARRADHRGSHRAGTSRPAVHRGRVAHPHGLSAARGVPCAAPRPRAGAERFLQRREPAGERVRPLPGECNQWFGEAFAYSCSTTSRSSVISRTAHAGPSFVLPEALTPP